MLWRHPTLSVALLPAAVLLATAITTFISAVGGPALLSPDSVAATGAAVTLAAIAADADREHRATVGRTAEPHSQDRLAVRAGMTHVRIMPDAMTGQMTLPSAG